MAAAEDGVELVGMVCGEGAGALDLVMCYGWSMGLALFFTLLVALVLVQNLSEASLSAITRCFPFWLYFLLMAVGNVATTLFATQYTQNLPMSPSFWAAFIGVFAFEQIISKLNIGIGEESLLNIRDRIRAAQDNAIAAAIKQDVLMDQ